ncbi:nicotinate-nucleotide adenylyltransferase [Lentilactobacillus hilgardii]|uniref:Probable nicotinate-nucleotide adenylyltransferase n=1 Tax=Lentilactobacillus hilgardii (strain ATCC 8290 / DSM 20176 / CCUG 30140 / JCM 1155 / KCTC 3500 / NBRC 15886 / NCIMB 8040 / NRRL B-1843 / 9) TaxID=1423757 RepID=C0XMC3_LENH9|nr:nicotinate-nucleotide adenylyltransferase [Lentilactobacillus hilgardii]EEI18717.1 nicotinate-nucleotide adenylyltransferase [Lentilactobacillus buchneri ATCC 11577]EEI23471.1 nicotinate-nucleotide adenylyltransferase [Lentilactobacillus hilgardii DSM 20176 = ATCC 8290]KRK58403.1 Nicotinate-nucleotide adenylyltransferase [Lentilactobacillus hilgardii DSM 20176 = ATCC 8290]MCP9332135.1 nicotinate-nucleotide adenylyltransferase [Lentilactobacillus hilgardii]MCP9350565.1 nicotinate-nucleotide 
MVNVSQTVQTLPKTKVVTQGKRKRVGILGGTFNPIHNGHLIIAEQVRDQLGLDRVYFMPDANPPHVDPKFAIDAKDRVAMVNLAITGNSKFAIEMTEIFRGGVSYSYDTMLDLTRRHPENQYYFIIGGDMVNYLSKWHRIDDLVKLVSFVGVKRDGYTPSSKYPIIWVDVPYIDISSTLIRSKIRQHQSIRYLAPDAVLKYIKENQLYEK